MIFNSDYSFYQKTIFYRKFIFNFLRACIKGISPFNVSFVGYNTKLIRFANNHGKMANVGSNVVIDLHRASSVKIGERFSLGDFSKISSCGSITSDSSGSLIIGDNVGISEYFCLYLRASVNIEDKVIIGPRVTIVAENHDIKGACAVRDLGLTRDGITIKEGAWIGSGVTILDGVVIGRNCIVAAGAVVTKDVDDFTIVAGVPAKNIGVRK